MAGHEHKWNTYSVDGGWLEQCDCGAQRFTEIEPTGGFTVHEYPSEEAVLEALESGRGAQK